MVVQYVSTSMALDESQEVIVSCYAPWMCVCMCACMCVCVCHRLCVGVACVSVVCVCVCKW